MADKVTHTNAHEYNKSPFKSPGKGPGKWLPPPPLEKLPFEGKLVEELLKRVPGYKLRDALEWVESEAIVKELRKWKEKNLDDMSSYSSTRLKFGDNPLAITRDENAELLLESVHGYINVVEGKSAKVPNTKHILWKLEAQSIAELSGTLDDDGDSRRLRYRLAYGLLIIVFRDIERNSTRYFQKALGGAVVAENFFAFQAECNSKREEIRKKHGCTRRGKGLGAQQDKDLDLDGKTVKQEAMLLVRRDQIEEDVFQLTGKMRELNVEKGEIKGKLAAIQKEAA